MRERCSTCDETLSDEEIDFDLGRCSACFELCPKCNWTVGQCILFARKPIDNARVKRIVLECVPGFRRIIAAHHPQFLETYDKYAILL